MDISNDVWNIVLSSLPPADLVKVAQTCSRMRDCCKSLPVWTELRQELRLRVPKRRPKSDYALVVKAACFKCRFQKKMPDLPLCQFCVGSHFPLGRLRLKAQSMAREVSNARFYGHIARRQREPDAEKLQKRIRLLEDSLDSTRSQFDAELAKHELKCSR